MATWRAVVAAAPEFAQRVRSLFDAGRHKTLATLRADGSPRISGIETEFDDDELSVGMMPGSVKVRDLRRDPRLALHSPSVDPPQDSPGAWPGEAKISGRAVEVSAGGPEGAVRFRVDVRELVLTRVGDPSDHLVIESWHEATGYRRRERR